jgi:hypothetical protein
MELNMQSRIVILLAFTLVAACGGGTGQVRLSLTDSPSDLVNVSQVMITVDEVRIHDDASSSQPGAGPDAARDGVDGGGWIILCSDVQTLDLLQLTNGRFGALCPEAAADGGTTSKLIDVPAGRISQLRLHLASAGLTFNDGTPPASLTVPSGSTSGLKINIDRDVPKGGLLDLKLDFNAASSITRLGSSSYRLGPVLTVLP